MTVATTPIKGLRFKHRRVLDPSKMPDKVPMIYEVSAIRCGMIYYRPIYTYYTRNDSREEIGKPECVLAENWCRVFLDAI